MSREDLAFRVECEDMHSRLCHRSRTVYLHRDNTLAFANAVGAVEVGTYTGAIDLIDFRRDCFWTLGRRSVPKGCQ